MTTYIYPTAAHGVSDDFQDHVNRGSVNPGTDYVSSYGSAVWAVAAGTVTDASNDPGGGGGRTIHVNHDDGSGADYLHLASVGVNVGQWVGQGYQIGVSGASGYGDNYYYGAHLHISFRYNHAQGYGNNGNVDFDAIMRAQGSSTPSPTPSPIGDDMSNIIHHPNGSLGLAGSDGSFTVLTNMDQVNSLIAVGAVPADDSKWVWAPDGLMWNKLQEVASKRSATNNPSPSSGAQSAPAGVSTAQYVVGGAGLLLILLALLVVPFMVAFLPNIAAVDLVTLEKFLVAGGLAFIGVAVGLTRVVGSGGGRRRRTEEAEPVPIYRPGTSPEPKPEPVEP
jgi:murein DD-endopeptidase MepM/ murein hydrolase activator NlpD